MTIPDPPAQPPAPTDPQGAHTANNPAKPTRRRTITTAAIGFLAGAAAVAAAWAITTADGNTWPLTGNQTAAADPATFDLTGEFTLTEGAVSDGMEGCEGTGGFDDIAMGTSVTVYDAAGTIIATDSLVLSEWDGAGSCTFDISVSDVPTGEDFYQVEISHRGKIQLSAAEAEAGEFAGSLG
ncbi:hypothetical protein [Streptomyces sp. NPDC060366]|uniref:hypothetical protein n=1 Tax=Streptomyces sp. NPDC060366 TaxID=3347105 RepID=UPI00364807EA